MHELDGAVTHELEGPLVVTPAMELPVVLRRIRRERARRSCGLPGIEPFPAPEQLVEYPHGLALPSTHVIISTMRPIDWMYHRPG